MSSKNWKSQTFVKTPTGQSLIGTFEKTLGRLLGQLRFTTSNFEQLSSTQILDVLSLLTRLPLTIELISFIDQLISIVVGLKRRSEWIPMQSNDSCPTPLFDVSLGQQSLGLPEHPPRQSIFAGNLYRIIRSVNALSRTWAHSTGSNNPRAGEIGSYELLSHYESQSQSEESQSQLEESQNKLGESQNKLIKNIENLVLLDFAPLVIESSGRELNLHQISEIVAAYGRLNSDDISRGRRIQSVMITLGNLATEQVQLSIKDFPMHTMNTGPFIQQNRNSRHTDDQHNYHQILFKLISAFTTKHLLHQDLFLILSKTFLEHPTFLRSILLQNLIKIALNFGQLGLPLPTPIQNILIDRLSNEPLGLKSLQDASLIASHPTLLPGSPLVVLRRVREDLNNKRFNKHNIDCLIRILHCCVSIDAASSDSQILQQKNSVTDFILSIINRIPHDRNSELTQYLNWVELNRK